MLAGRLAKKKTVEEENETAEEDKYLSKKTAER